MTEQTGAATAQGAEDAQSQGDTSPAQGAAADAQGAGDTSESASVEALTAKVAALEKDNRSYRQQLKAAHDAKTTAATTEQSEAEALAAKVTALEQQVADERRERQEQSLRLASITAAQRLGFRNPDLAFRLLDQSTIVYGEDGNPRNVDKLLTDLAKAEPYLVAATDFGGGVRGSSGGQGTDMNALIRQAAKRP